MDSPHAYKESLRIRCGGYNIKLVHPSLQLSYRVEAVRFLDDMRRSVSSHIRTLLTDLIDGSHFAQTYPVGRQLTDNWIRY